MFKISERTSVKLHILSYAIILIAFSLIGLKMKMIEWKLLSFALVLCALIGLIYRFVIIRNFVKNESNSADFEKKKEQMLFTEKVLGIVPIGIVFLIAAIYSIFNQGEFLPMHTSIILLVGPPFVLFNQLRSRKKSAN